MAIIGMSGKARSGKDTFANMLMQELNKKGERYITMAYADDLKERVMKDFHLTPNQIYGDLKEVPDERYPKTDGNYWTPREILQYMGTEGFRYIEPLFWVRRLFEKAKEFEVENIIVTDCRFPDEVDAILEVGGIHIKIVRENKDYVTDTTHISETALDDYPFYTHVVYNNYSLDDLRVVSGLIAEQIVRLEVVKTKNKSEGESKWQAKE